MTATTWRALTVAAVLAALALAVAAPIHPEVEAQGDDHCSVCHLRHVSGIAPAIIVVPASPLFAARAPLAEKAENEQTAFFRLHPSRGPPA